MLTKKRKRREEKEYIFKCKSKNNTKLTEIIFFGNQKKKKKEFTIYKSNLYNISTNKYQIYLNFNRPLKTKTLEKLN